MVVLTLLEDDDLESKGYEIRKAVDEKGDGVYATKEFKAGETIFDEVPAVLCPHDRRFCCFHCCKPIESVNQAVQRMAKDPKLKFFQIIPTEKKPDVIIDDITKLRFCCAECYTAAMDSYFATFRGKWLQYRNIEDWIVRNKGPPHDIATLMAIFKILCLEAQGSDTFYGVDTMIASRQTENMKRFTKVIHEKMKTNNIFNDSNPNTMFRWASIIAANFQIGTVSPIKRWVSAFKECKALSKTQQATIFGNYQEFTSKAKDVYTKKLKKKNLPDSSQKSSSTPHLSLEFRALYNDHARLNHSCLPNSKIAYLDNSAKVSVIATRDIYIGDEITFDYTAGGLNISKIGDRAERKSKLSETLNFDCSCCLCKDVDDSWIDVD